MLTGIDIAAVEEVAEGDAFGATGAYRRIIATARGELDPGRAENRGIVNLDKAPRNANGRVAYHCDLFILRPANAAKGNGRLLYEVNNRGRKLLFANLCNGAAGNDLKARADFGDALPLRLGFTVAWSGWDATLARANAALALSAPAPLEDGRAIIRTIRDEFVAGTRPDSPVDFFRLSYAAATLDRAQARLTRRRRQEDPRETVPPAEWEFLDARRVRLLPAGAKPEPGMLYELVYSARDPVPLGIGFAATRDVVSHLRRDPAAAELLGRRPSHALAFGISQAGRYLRDHIAQGFNRDEDGRRVFDGVLAHTAGIGRLFLNQPFAQPFRTNTQHEDHDFPENGFPFSPAAMADPLTGRSGALLRGDGSDPLLIQTNTSTEYWQKGASLLHTDPLGTRDAALPETVRLYLIAGTQHGGRAGSPADRGPAANPRNPHNPMPALRALLVALDQWVTEGRAPPPSEVPSLAGGTLVPAEACGFPEIPGVAVARRTNRVTPPGDWVEPKPAPGAYRPLVCRVDADGNELAGIRLPDIAVPLGSHTGWNLYRAPYPEGELADRDGSFIPFARSAADRQATGDPRLSLAECYGDKAAFVAAVERAAAALLERRLLLAEDAAAYGARARASEAF
ncbi:MAG TPA: alpha/beta hydrolase domain-containing protein [Stellaceae bacterium]|nr:alpha/beta hydrolase domain-containing protein [Stellaceae bacterium]